MATNKEQLRLLIRILQPHWLVAIGEVLFGAALFYNPRAGAPYALLGVDASYAMATLMLFGAALSVRAYFSADVIVRTLGYMFGIFPIIIYAGSVMWLFVVVRGIGSPTAPLTTPLAYAGVFVLALSNYVLVVQLEQCLLDGDTTHD